ncbi:E3 ubiquitin-protein ligase UPL2-like protein [Babesia caballi]|uniref:E3 ubiquitin-protein ligase UPL2-like protein n=1 Tax=Babesia caballi TaxID=5871 RepID=A0AAV4LNF0_BABCB|nr:E3 ubiquitin-protein ligase UPL2-like protein [Babesia caballi]
MDQFTRVNFIVARLLRCIVDPAHRHRIILAAAGRPSLSVFSESGSERGLAGQNPLAHLQDVRAVQRRATVVEVLIVVALVVIIVVRVIVVAIRSVVVLVFVVIIVVVSRPIDLIAHATLLHHPGLVKQQLVNRTRNALPFAGQNAYLHEGRETEEIQFPHVLGPSTGGHEHENSYERFEIGDAFQRRIFPTGVGEQHGDIPDSRLEIHGSLRDCRVVGNDGLRKFLRRNLQDAVASAAIYGHLKHVGKEALRLLRVLHGDLEGEAAGGVRQQTSDRVAHDAEIHYNHRVFLPFVLVNRMLPHVGKTHPHGRRLFLTGESDDLVRDLRQVAEHKRKVVDELHQPVEVQVFVQGGNKCGGLLHDFCKHLAVPGRHVLCVGRCHKFHDRRQRLNHGPPRQHLLIAVVVPVTVRRPVGAEAVPKGVADVFRYLRAEGQHLNRVFCHYFVERGNHRFQLDAFHEFKEALQQVRQVFDDGALQRFIRGVEEPEDRASGHDGYKNFLISYHFQQHGIQFEERLRVPPGAGAHDNPSAQPGTAHAEPLV